jgi:hypothetical protein
MSGIGFGRQRLVSQIIKENWKVIPESKKFNFNELLFVIQEMLNQEGKPYFEPKQTLRGHHIFRAFAKHLLYRNIANFDSMVLITSDKGMGKSSAAIMLAREWCKNLGIRFNPQRHIAYSNNDVMTKIDMLNRFEPIICDEAVRFAQAAEWAKREHRELKKKLAQIRTKHLLYILCFPLKIYKVEKNYLESFTNYWIDLFARGVGAIYVKDRNPVMDAWKFKEFQQVGSYTEFTDIVKIEQKLKYHPNFWSIIKFPRPPEWLYKRYLTVREKNIYDDQNVLANISKEDIYRALIILSLRDIMVSDVTLNMNRIILHIRNTYDLTLSKQMVENIIEDSKQLVIKIREQAIQL